MSALWLRIAAFPVLSLRHEVVGGPVICRLWGLVPLKQKRFELVSIVATDGTRLRLKSATTTYVSLLLTYENGPKRWRLGGSQSETRIRQLAELLHSGQYIDF